MSGPTPSRLDFDSARARMPSRTLPRSQIRSHHARRVQETTARLSAIYDLIVVDLTLE